MKNKIIWISNFTYDLYYLFFNIADNLILNWYKVVFLMPNETLKVVLKNRKYDWINNINDFKKEFKNFWIILFWEWTRKETIDLINFTKSNNIKTLYFENWYFNNTLQIDTKWQNKMSTIYNLNHNEIINYKRNIKTYNLKEINIQDFNLNNHEKYKIILNVKKTLKSIYNFIKIKILENYRNKIIKKEKNKTLEKWNYVFIPFQVHDDSQIILYSEIIKKMDDILNYFYSDIKEILPGYKIIVKEHPMDIWRINYTYLKNKYSDIIWIKWWNLEDIIDKSEYIVVTNSSVWLQCLEKWKKVLLLWNAFYENNPFIEKINNKDNFKEKLIKLKNKQLNKNEISNYILKFKNEIFFEWSIKKLNKEWLKRILNFIIQINKN